MRLTFLVPILAAVLAAGLEAAPPEGDLLYNGIRLPSPWPPRTGAVPPEPAPPPYLVSPPAVIPIDVGRQLFVDDFLVAETTLSRTYHLPTYHPASPVLRPDRAWEEGARGDGPVAMVFSDGVWYDPKDRLFKMWYMGGWCASTCLAVSKDGIAWEKPAFDVKPGTNVVHAGPRDSNTVWLDLEEADPARRFKMFRSCSGGSTVKGSFGLATHFSADGVHWSEPPLLTGSCGDRSTVFRNPFRRVWIYSLRHGWGEPRRRRYWEVPDLLAGPPWSAIAEPWMWCGADARDPARDDLRIPPQLYNLDAVAYESLLLGLFTVWRGQPKDRQKPNDVVLGYSRDGWHWHRPDRRAFCPVSERFGDWNYANVQSAGGGCLVVGDRLYFYVSGRAGQAGTNKSGACATGLAVLRRDGFASMDAGEAGGTLTTRPVRFQGRHGFVNVDAPAGELRAELLDEGGAVLATSAPIKGDTVRGALRWEGRDDLAAFAGRAVRFRFHLRNGRLYAFWVSASASGASGGYVAAGGPGLAGPTDADEAKQ